jgi:hypothetical protein
VQVFDKKGDSSVYLIKKVKGGIPMDLDTFIITVECFVDDMLTASLGGKRLRSRGPAPTLSDSEVLTIEMVGEFLGIDQDKAIFDYARSHYGHFFPGLLRIHRTTFTRQAANLWACKWLLWQNILRKMPFDWKISLPDSFPMPVCKFARANRHRTFKGQAAYGYDVVIKQVFYGFRIHLRVCWPGVITVIAIVPANVHELEVAPSLLEGARGYGLGDRNYWSPDLKGLLRQQGLIFLAPFRQRSRERKPWPKRLNQIRRRIDTVIGQLVERYNAKRVWARDIWHLISRVLHKVLSHTMAVYLNMQLASLVTS